MNEAKPFSQACENNQSFILDILSPLLSPDQRVLEVGSGTGQHAVYFAANMPAVQWQCSDRRENLDGINAWLNDAELDNLAPPLALDARDVDWPQPAFDAIYSANTLHIMSWHEVELLFTHLRKSLKETGLLCIYGPFKYHGEYTSPSNAGFDQWLKQRNPQSGIRDFEAVNTLAEKIGLALQADHAMPANNRLLVWQSQAA
jgi:cyclopropane fatty-acyl-phospholipid synthase-like methyltransferase